MKVTALWSGGKDSCFACYKAMSQGMNVAYITTFLWETPSLGHPQELISLQSEASGIRHVTTKVKEPYFEGYREAISRFIKEDGIEGIVTGDISFIDSYHGDWIGDVCKGLDVEVIRPLWGLDRYEIMNDMLTQGFKAVFSCVKEPWFDENWLGREIDWQCLKELTALEEKYGMDICGEMGEYHTMMIDGPIFRQAIQIDEFTKEKKESAFYMKPIRLSLKPKDI
jgi:diphthine-ammonia ligase